jgi:hypothetical protein
MSATTPTTGPEMFAFLREQLFGGDVGATVGANPAGVDEVHGVVMEMGVPNGAAVVFGMRDGSASVYLSSGGGSIGGQGRPHINAAAIRLVEAGKGFVAKFPLVTEHPLPASGRIRFSLLTTGGVRAVEVAEAELLDGASDLTPLFHGAHQIIAGFRMAEEGRKPDARMYVVLLLTALARGHAASAVLTAGERLPDPAALTDDEQDLAWFASLGLDVGAQSTDKVIAMLLEAAGFRRFHLRKTEGQIRTALRAHDGESSTDFDFKLIKRSAADGRLQIEIVPRSGAG